MISPRTPRKRTDAPVGMPTPQVRRANPLAGCHWLCQCPRIRHWQSQWHPDPDQSSVPLRPRRTNPIARRAKPNPSFRTKPIGCAERTQSRAERTQAGRAEQTQSRAERTQSRASQGIPLPPSPLVGVGGTSPDRRPSSSGRGPRGENPRVGTRAWAVPESKLSIGPACLVRSICVTRDKPEALSTPCSAFSERSQSSRRLMKVFAVSKVMDDKFEIGQSLWVSESVEKSFKEAHTIDRRAVWRLLKSEGSLPP
jgi:hypothetical protein